MKTLRKIFALIFLACCYMPVHSMCPVQNDSIHLEVILSSDMLKKINMNVNFTSSLVVTQNGHLLLSSSNQFYLLGWGGILPVGPKAADSISAFTYSSDGYLMITRNNELCYVDSVGNLVKLYEIPNKGMGIAGGGKNVYLFDQRNNQKSHSIYVLAIGKKYYELITIPTPINAVIGTTQNVLFASENKLFAINKEDNAIKVLAVCPATVKIISITYDSTQNVIFFSSKNAIYALKDTVITCITDQFGGMLKYFDNGLIVYAPAKQFIVRLCNEPKPVGESKPSADTLTNTNIAEMVKAMLSDEMIIRIINKSEVNFNMNVDSMIFLSSQHVSSAVIMAMKNSMKRKNMNK